MLIYCSFMQYHTYHGGFSNGAKAVDENVTRNIDWRTCRESDRMIILDVYNNIYIVIISNTIYF